MSRNISVSLQCFVRDNERVLMLHRAPHKRIMPNVWMAPGGRREFNEGLFECARREIREETGLEIRNLKVKATGVAYMEDIDLELYFHFVLAELAGGHLEGTPEDGELAWVTVSELHSLDNLLAELKHVLSYIFDETDGIVSYKAVYKSGNQMTSFLLENPE